MAPYQLQLLESIIAILVYVISFFVTRNIINKSLKKTQLERTRRKIIIKALHLIITIIFIMFLGGIWGVKQSEIVVFAGTLLTALGIAFFAQWSLLSNITSSIILFFNHPLKLGDTIKILDKDYPYEGEVVELTYFFIHLKSTTAETITIPNSLILQKSIAIIAKQSQR
ncbi:MAG: mechanosensitive ion channel family protein [Bacteroidetes bacterium]|nr:mechanosensitive ion channel family protein [Bacteroidota bacterium]